MHRSATSYVFALAGVAALSWLTSMALPLLGLASSALLFLLPVLYASVRGGLGSGLIARRGQWRRERWRRGRLLGICRSGLRRDASP